MAGLPANTDQNKLNALFKDVRQMTFFALNLLLTFSIRQCGEIREVKVHELPDQTIVGMVEFVDAVRISSLILRYSQMD